ncbi:MAG: hypothetical protein IT304_13170, partial [Dehalococcoidia bacterium]|nr:hypothetical protein [Dehalococcoidia bacterium]
MLDFDKRFDEPADDQDAKNLQVLLESGLLRLGELDGEQLIRLRNRLEGAILRHTTTGDFAAADHLKALADQVNAELRELE